LVSTERLLELKAKLRADYVKTEADLHAISGGMQTVELLLEEDVPELSDIVEVVEEAE
jgi:hypothetical protein